MTEETENLMYENDNYKVIVGAGAFPIYDDVFPEAIYQVVNKRTNMVEAEDLILVAACSKARHFNDELVKFENEYVGKKAETIKLIN